MRPRHLSSPCLQPRWRHVHMCADDLAVAATVADSACQKLTGAGRCTSRQACCEINLVAHASPSQR
eukprot:1220749-Alexandrium_andersonii.AAC.1